MNMRYRKEPIKYYKTEYKRKTITQKRYVIPNINVGTNKGAKQLEKWWCFVEFSAHDYLRYDYLRRRKLSKME